jgi:predicted XRE-type DNA-binding protein
MSAEPNYTMSSGNVFADLGLPDPDTRLAKAELALRISTFIDERGLTQREAAELLGIDQPKVSAITRGRLTDFSLERLLTLVTRLGMDIEIVVGPRQAGDRVGRMVVRTDDEAIVAGSPSP